MLSDFDNSTDNNDLLNQIFEIENCIVSSDENNNNDNNNTNNKDLVQSRNNDLIENQNKYNMIQINDGNKENSTEVTKKTLGKKRKNGQSKGIHDKYAGDNLILKIKTKVLSCISEYINGLISKTYNDNINHGLLLKQLLPVDQDKKQNLKYLQNFIYKTLKEIFAVNISKKYSNFLKEHNIKLINNLLNHKNEKISKLYNNIFNLSFIECLNHICGKKSIKELVEIKTINDICDSMSLEEEEYKNVFKETAIKLETLLMNKRSRNRKKGKTNDY